MYYFSNSNIIVNVLWSRCFIGVAIVTPLLFDRLKNFCYNKYIEKNTKGENPMLKINLNELSALEFVLNYISVKDLLTFATLGFAESNTERNQDNADICTKSLQVFLR